MTARLWHLAVLTDCAVIAAASSATDPGTWAAGGVFVTLLLVTVRLLMWTLRREQAQQAARDQRIRELEAHIDQLLHSDDDHRRNPP